MEHLHKNDAQKIFHIFTYTVAAQIFPRLSFLKCQTQVNK